MKKSVKRIAKVFLPPHTRRFRLVRNLAASLTLLPPISPDRSYGEWVERTEPFIWSPIKSLGFTPKISVVVPVFNTPERYLWPMLYSVVNQEGYENWELVLVDASTSSKPSAILEKCSEIDKRIKVVRTVNKGIAGNTNIGIKNASGEYIALLDHDDTLSPRALYEIVLCLQGQPAQRPQLLYSDEDKLTDNGEHRFDPFFKPDWSPRLLQQVNYINHFSVIDKKLLEEVRGYRQGYDGSQDYDLYLRLVDKGAIVAHVPKILYHWRAAHNSTARDFSTKKQKVLEAGIKALQEHLERNGQRGEVTTIADQPGFYRITYEPKKVSGVAVLVLPTEDPEQYNYLLKHTIHSLRRSSLSVDLLVAGEGDTETIKNVRIQRSPVKNKRKFVESALEKTASDIVVIFNSASVPRNDDWLEQIAGILSQNPAVGVIAPVLLDPQSKNIRDGGFVRHDGTTIGLFQGMRLGDNTYFGNTIWTRNLDYLSGRVTAFRRNVFEKYVRDDSSFYDRDNLFDAEPYKAMIEDGLEVAVFPQIKMDYYGELSPAQYHAPYFNPSLSVIRYEPGLAKNINVPPEVEDEKS